jgi:hypothetical protein
LGTILKILHSHPVPKKTQHQPKTTASAAISTLISAIAELAKPAVIKVGL